MSSREVETTIFFLVICQILKRYGTLKIRYLSYIAITHKAMLVSSGKRSSRGSRPLGVLFKIGVIERFCNVSVTIPTTDQAQRQGPQTSSSFLI